MRKYLILGLLAIGRFFMVAATTLFVRYALDISTLAQDRRMLELAINRTITTIDELVNIPNPLADVNMERLRRMRDLVEIGGYAGDTSCDEILSTDTGDEK